MEKYTCNGCINLLKLFKHPNNQNVFKGSISEPTGLYACIIFHKMDSKGMAVLFDREDAGGCEMYDKGKSISFIENRLEALLSDNPTIEEQIKRIKTIEDITILKNYYVINNKFGEAAQIRNFEKTLPSKNVL